LATTGILKKLPADYTEGSIIASIMKMGAPSMIGFMTGHIYFLVDMWWLARLSAGETAVAAITIFSNVAWVFGSINQLIGPGSVAIISRRYGEKKYDHAEAAIKETYILKWISGLIFGLIGLIFIEDIVYIAGARGETITMAVEYGRVMFIGLAFSLSTYSVYTALRGVANPHLAMGLMIGSTLLNLVLDPLFIFGYLGFPEMGVTGAAVASVISFTITFLVGAGLFFTPITNVRLHLKGKIPISISSMRQIMKIGIPSWFSGISFSGARFVIMPMIAVFGNSVIAAYGIGMQVTAIGMSVLVGIGLGLAALIGHNLGSGKKERAWKTGNQAIVLDIGVMAIFAVIVYVFAEPIMGIYFDNPETVGYGVELLRVLAIGFPFMGLFITLENIYVGVGKNTPAMIVSVCHSWLIQIPVIFVLTRILHMDQSAVWWAMTVSLMISSSVFYAYYRRGQWLGIKV